MGGHFKALTTIIKRFNSDGGMQMAASISYYALMSLLPLLFALINLFGYFVGRSPELHDAVVGYVKAVYPMMGATLTREINRVMEHSRLGWVGIAVFLWLGSLVFSSMEYSMNVIFKTDMRRRYVVSKSLAIGMVAMCGIFLAASFWAAYIPPFFERHQNIIPASRAVRLMTRSFMSWAVSFVLTLATFTAIYKVLPKRRVPTVLALVGGLTAASLWEAAKYAFAWYINNLSVVGGVYGSLSAMVVFLLWIFYSSTILLLVAEMVFLLDEKRNGLN